MCIHPCIMYIISCLCKARDNVNCLRCCACCSVLWLAFSQQVKLGHWNSWRSLVENLTTLFPQHCKLPCNYSHWGSALSSALTSSHVAKLTVMKPLTPAPNSKCYARCLPDTTSQFPLTRDWHTVVPVCNHITANQQKEICGLVEIEQAFDFSVVGCSVQEFGHAYQDR